MHEWARVDAIVDALNAEGYIVALLEPTSITGRGMPNMLVMLPLEEAAASQDGNFRLMLDMVDAGEAEDTKHMAARLTLRHTLLANGYLTVSVKDAGAALATARALLGTVNRETNDGD